MAGTAALGIPRRSLNPGALPFSPPSEAVPLANYRTTAPATQLAFGNPFVELQEHTPTPVSFQSMRAESVSTVTDNSFQGRTSALEMQAAQRVNYSDISIHTLLAGTIHSATSAIPSATYLRLQSENPSISPGLTTSGTTEATEPESTPKKQDCLNEAWDRATREMALHYPAEWANLAANSYQQLVQKFAPSPVPDEVLEAHKEQFSSVYARGPLEGEICLRQCLTVIKQFAEPVSALSFAVHEYQQALPANLQNLINAGVQATMMNSEYMVKVTDLTSLTSTALQGTPKRSVLAEYFVAAALLTLTRRFTTSTITEEEFLTPTLDRHQLLQKVLDSEDKPFSPGPAFPALGTTQAGDLSHSASSSSLTLSSREKEKVLTRDAPMDYVGDQNATIQIPYPGGPVPYNHNRTMPRNRGTRRRQSSGCRFPIEFGETFVSLNAFMKGPMQGGRGHGRKPSNRRIRTDQGPLPSDADIYPDDELPELPQETVHPIDEGIPWHHVSPERPGAAYLQALKQLELEAEAQQQQQQPNATFQKRDSLVEKEDFVSPTTSATPKAQPKAFTDYIPLGGSQYLNIVTGQVASAQDANAAHDTHDMGVATAAALSCASPLSLTFTPRQDFIERITDSPNPDFLRGKQRLPKLDPNVQRPPAKPMDEDQRNGTRYGIRVGGIGWGDSWAPPEPQRGSAFWDAGFLWSK